jgi:hypothetical protein
LPRLLPIVVLLKKPVDFLADPAAHRIEIQTGAPPSGPLSWSTAGHPVHELTSCFQELVETAIPLITEPIQPIKTLLHTPTLPTAAAQPLFPPQSQQHNHHTAALQ